MGKRPAVVIWLPDGGHVTAADASEALDSLAAMQWTPCSRPRLKRLLSRRLWQLQSIYVDPKAPDEEFLADLHKAGMLRVDRVPFPGR